MQLHRSSYARRSCKRLVFQRYLLCYLQRFVQCLLQICTFTVSLIGLATPFTAAHAQNTSNIPTSAWLQQSMTLADARHLAGRTGLGASPEELSALMNMSRADAVRVIVDTIDTHSYIPMPAWVDAPAPHYWTRRFLSPPMKQAFDAERDKEIVQLRRWWVNNMLQTDSPQTERLVLFWHDHFATSYEGVDRRSISMARQNQLFREMGTGSYRSLLKAMIRDPAMLLYLDNQSNRKGRPNENLARELLELFTLGEGNYDEVTVKEAARALTGYGISDTHNMSFQLHGNKRDMEEKTLFGKRAVHDGDALIDLILEQPEAAEHLVKKFWHAFISDAKPDPAFVDALSKEFRESDYDLQHLYSSVLMSKAFWQDENRLALIKSPATLLIGTARSLDYPKRVWTQLPSLLAMLGMNLFSPPNVAGWDEGAAYVVPGRLLNRQLAMQTLLSVPAAASMDSQSMSMDASGSDNQMMTSSSAMNASSKSSSRSSLQVRLAGHFFQGAPRYSVSLHGANENVLWTSDERELEIGYDTEMFGKMRDMSQLAWQTVQFYPPADALSKSVLVKIAFLNDAADDKGDRNLFIESVSMNNNTFAAEGALQESTCPPKNRHNAGSLYCAGTVAIELAQPVHNISRDEPFTASSASLLWAQQKKKKLAAAIALENVQTPQGNFHTVSFHVTSKNDNDLEIILDSFSCWPDCIDQWPECAWVDDRSGQKSVVFPLRRGQNKQVDCHYDSLTSPEQALINAIYVSVPDLIEQVSDKARNAKQKASIQRWQERIVGFDSHMKASEYGVDATPFSINQHYAQPARQPVVLADPFIAINSIDTFARLASEARLSLPQLLIGGTPARQFPDLQRDLAMPIQFQLEKLLTHPVYQVY